MLYDIDRIFVFDDVSENGQSLELRISKKNFTKVESDHEYDQLIENRELKYWTSGGTVFIPPNIPISIESCNPVFGLIGAFGYVYSKENIDLRIKHDKSYNVVLESPFNFNINHKIISPEEFKDYTKLMDYSELWNNFDELYVRSLPEPKEIEDDDSIRADFSKSRRETIYAHELCEFSDALYLESEGSITIYDKGIKLKESQKKSINFNNEEFIRNSLLNALIRGDVPSAKRAFRNWKYYIIYKNKTKKGFFENKRIKKISDIFTPESFQENSQDT